MTDELKVVGKNLPRKDALKKATGAAQYSIDIKLPDMLFGECALSTAAPAIANAIYNPIGIRVSLPTMLDKGLKALNQNWIRLLNLLKNGSSKLIRNFIDNLNSLSIPTRYPDELEKLLKDYRKNLTEEVLKQTKELLSWLKKKK